MYNLLITTLLIFMIWAKGITEYKENISIEPTHYLRHRPIVHYNKNITLLKNTDLQYELHDMLQ